MKYIFNHWLHIAAALCLSLAALDSCACHAAGQERTGGVIQERLKSDGWEPINISTGESLECYKIRREHGPLDNHLKVTVGARTDAVIKVMKRNTDQCIRVAYVKGGDTYYIRNIPEGIYYLKIAYGRDLRKRLINGQCHLKFMDSVLYERGDNELDFRIRETEDGYELPMYELFLDVIATGLQNSLVSHTITEGEFNR